MAPSNNDGRRRPLDWFANTLAKKLRIKYKSRGEDCARRPEVTADAAPSQQQLDPGNRQQESSVYQPRAFAVQGEVLPASIPRQRPLGVQSYTWVNNTYGTTNNINHVQNAHFGDIIEQTNVYNYHANNVLWESLPKLRDMSGHRSDYLEGSRQGDIEKIWGWMDSPSPELVLWVHGPAGFGKSTLAREIAHRLRSAGRLGAFVSLTALPANGRGPESIIQIIARELGEMHPDSIQGITRAIASCKGGPIQEQLIKYLGEPVRSLQLTVGSLLVVLDAVDEWEFHDLLVKELGCLASLSSLKFILLGRSDPWARGSKAPFIRLHHLEPVSTAVMEKYFTKQFDAVEWDYGHKPSSHYISSLAQQADGLFMWSNIVCSLLKKGLGLASPNRTLESILYSRRKVGETGDLTNLYNDVLSWLFPDAEEQQLLRLYLGTILALQEPLPLDGLAALIKVPARSIEIIQSRLKALCIRQPTDSKPMVYPAKTLFHLSFVEYLQHSSTSTTVAFAISLLSAHSDLAEACLGEMANFLSTPQDPASLYLSAIRQYALKYWPFHLTNGTPSVEPDSYTEWEKTKLCSILRSIPMDTYRKWESLFVGLIARSAPGATLDDEEALKEEETLDEETLDGETLNEESLSGDDVGVLMQRVARSVPGNDSGLATFTISCLGVVTRLRPGDVDGWRILGEAYWGLARASASRDLVHQTVLACHNALKAGTKSERVDQGGLLFSLGASLYNRFNRLGGYEDRDQSISLLRNALDFLPPSHPRYLSLVDGLAVALLSRFETTGFTDDLEEAIRLRKVTDGLALNGPVNLACCLLSRFERMGNVDDLHEAIRLHEGERALYTPDHPDRFRYLTNVGNCLRGRFEAMGDINDLQEAITSHREALTHTPPGHPDRFLSLDSLADDLRCLFETKASIQDLDEAITLFTEAFGLCPPHHRYRFSTVNNLGRCLLARFQTTGDINDLQETTGLHREVLGLLPPSHWTYSSSLYNLANCLSFRFISLDDIDDVHEAIGLHKESLALRPPGHCERSGSLNNLALCHLFRFEKMGDVDDLHRSISLLREVSAHRPPGHPDRAASLNNLAQALQSDGSIASLEEANQLWSEALALLPPDSPDLPSFLSGIPTSLPLRRERRRSRPARGDSAV